MLNELLLYDIDNDSVDFDIDVDVYGTIGDDGIGNVEVLNVSCAGRSLK